MLQQISALTEAANALHAEGTFNRLVNAGAHLQARQQATHKRQALNQGERAFLSLAAAEKTASQERLPRLAEKIGALKQQVQ